MGDKNSDINKCSVCGNETSNPKYCSRSCSAKETNKLYPKKIRKTKCLKCDNITKSYRTKFCEEHQEEYIKTRFDYIKDKTLEEYWDKESLKNLHTSSKNAHIRALARSNLKHLTSLPCANCGYDKHVELCHIKAVSKFLPSDKVGDVNSEKNIIQLCRNCHWEFDNGLLDIKK